MATITTTEIPVTLNKDEILRYSRHLIMPEVGMEGQQKLKAARVLCIGTGGLGSPLALYLAAAGVGTLGLVDFDVVDYTNLQRQIIHSTADVGRKKLDSAADKLKGINPFLNLRTFDTMLNSSNAMELFRDFDIIADGTDNFPTRYLVNDACVLPASQMFTDRFSASKARPACSPPKTAHAIAACILSHHRRDSFLPARKAACSEFFPVWSA